MKKRTIIPILLILLSCNKFDEEAVYEQKLTVFGHLTANMPMLEPIYVSRSSSIDEQVISSNLYISDATVLIHHGANSFSAEPVPDNPGQYITPQNVIFLPGETYMLEVSHEGVTIQAETTIPESMNLTSPSGYTFNCDGEEIGIQSLNVDNLDMTSYLPIGPIDTVVYKRGDCYAQSFASTPYFMLEFDEDSLGAIQTVTLALEAEIKDLEPYKDLNDNNQYDNSDVFTDYNRNGIRDSTYINIIYDTTDIFRVWKGRYFRDKDNNPFRYNPFVWNIETSPTPMSWLNFNYYGLHIVFLQATDDAFYNYFSGDPMGFNQYALPESNIEGGYGMFSSSYGKGFLVYIKPEEEI